MTFRITLISGEVATQEIAVPADPSHPIDKQTLVLMQQMLTQYVQVGMLRQPEKDHFVLLCPSQIATVECTMPSLVIANALEMPPEPSKGAVVLE